MPIHPKAVKLSLGMLFHYFCSPIRESPPLDKCNRIELALSPVSCYYRRCHHHHYCDYHQPYNLLFNYLCSLQLVPQSAYVCTGKHILLS